MSALIAARLDPLRVWILPPACNYPYDLHRSVPRGWRAGALDDLVCVAYEDRSLGPADMDDIAVREPLTVVAVGPPGQPRMNSRLRTIWQRLASIS